ncbi:MAG: HAD-IC family P-type ATPase, partial [bacterium]
AIMKVDKVGADCYATQLVSKAQTKKRASSEMQTTIGRIIKVVSVAIIPIGLLLYRSQAAANVGDFAGTVVRTVSGVIGMIPEGLVLLTSVSFIIGVGRLAQKKALVQEMEAIEALARTNILCTDKTGTITTGELKVHKILPFGSATAEQIRTILGHLNGAFDDTNATQEAMNRAFGTYDDWPVREIIPFSSSRKYRAASFAGRGDYAIGAPEFLMPGNGKLRALVEKYSEEGYRVLLLGRSSGISAAMDSHGSITPVALIIISDIIKEDAKEIFNYFADSGVEVKVLSGDNPVTVSTVARRAGVRGAENYVDATTLPENPAELAREITKYSVFGRVKPEQKQAFVKAWQMSGRTVAMVGDGVNDVLAIKDADCGIAMAAGSEAAKQAAHIVLMDSDFSSMKDIVKEGRTIISNIERVSSLYLTKTIYSSVLCLIFILLQTKYPFTTLQMGLINVCGIGMPSFLLTLEQQDNVHSEGFLKHILAVCLPAAMTFVSTMMIVQIMNAVFRWPTDIYATFNLMLGGFVALLVVADVCWPLNDYRKFVLITSVVVFVAGMIFLPGFYDMHSLFMWWSILLIPLGFLVAMMLFWFSRVTNRFMVKVLKSREGRKGIF